MRQTSILICFFSIFVNASNLGILNRWNVGLDPTLRQPDEIEKALFNLLVQEHMLLIQHIQTTLNQWIKKVIKKTDDTEDPLDDSFYESLITTRHIQHFIYEWYEEKRGSNMDYKFDEFVSYLNYLFESPIWDSEKLDNLPIFDVYKKLCLRNNLDSGFTEVQKNLFRSKEEAKKIATFNFLNSLKTRNKYKAKKNGSVQFEKPYFHFYTFLLHMSVYIQKLDYIFTDSDEDSQRNLDVRKKMGTVLFSILKWGEVWNMQAPLCFLEMYLSFNPQLTFETVLKQARRPEGDYSQDPWTLRWISYFYSTWFYLKQFDTPDKEVEVEWGGLNARFCVDNPIDCTPMLHIIHNHYFASLPEIKIPNHSIAKKPKINRNKNKYRKNKKKKPTITKVKEEKPKIEYSSYPQSFPNTDQGNEDSWKIVGKKRDGSRRERKFYYLKAQGNSYKFGEKINCNEEKIKTELMKKELEIEMLKKQIALEIEDLEKQIEVNDDKGKNVFVKNDIFELNFEQEWAVISDLQKKIGYIESIFREMFGEQKTGLISSIIEQTAESFPIYYQLENIADSFKDKASHYNLIRKYETIFLSLVGNYQNWFGLQSFQLNL